MTVPSNSSQQRFLAVIVIPIAVIALVAVLFAFMQANDQRAAAPTATATIQPAQATSTAPPSSSSPTILAPTPVIVPDEIVAQVNRRVIGRDLFLLAQGVDAAMADLVGSTPVQTDILVEQLINSELVLEQAQFAGFALSQAQRTAGVASLLESLGKSPADLEQALTAAGIALADFETYYGRLLTIEQFANQQAAAADHSLPEYLRGLQASAQISFGPAAALPTPPAEPAPIALEITPTPIPAVTGDRGTQRGQLAPNFDLPVLNHPTQDFLRWDQVLGKPTLLSFWTTWCPYCKAQTPVLIAAASRYADQIQFIGVNVREEQNLVQTYLNQNAIPYPVLLDTGGQVADSYNVSGFPTTYLLDANGVIVNHQIGQLKPEQIDEFLSVLLAPTP